MSKHDISILYKLIEDILFRDIDIESIYKSLVEINDMVITFNGWCLSNVHDPIHYSICNETLKLIDEVIDSVLKFLESRSIEGKIISSNDVLSKLYNLFLSTCNVLKNIVQNSIIIHGEKVLCRILKPISIYNTVIAKGFITPIHISLASILSALGYVEPIYVSIQIKK
ncbi:MAG: hypothetical protein QXK54_03270 [Ignisphaera sp.]